jgi:hypothetical protein
MRKFTLSVAAVVMLAAPATAHAGDRAKLTGGEARATTRAYVSIQVEALQRFPGLNVTSARISGRVDRLGPRGMIVPVAFTLRWDGGADFVCQNRIYVTEQGRSIRAHPGNFNCN